MRKQSPVPESCPSEGKIYLTHGFSAGNWEHDHVWGGHLGLGMRKGDLVFKKVEDLLNLKFCKNGALYLFTPAPHPP